MAASPKIIVNASDGTYFYGYSGHPRYDKRPGVLVILKAVMLLPAAMRLQPAALVEGPASGDRVVLPRIPRIEISHPDTRVFGLTLEAQEAWDRLIKGVERAVQKNKPNNRGSNNED